MRLAKGRGVGLRQSYVRVGKRALIMQGRYRHAKQHKRANKAMRKLKTYLGRTIRDIRRKTAADEASSDAFRRPLWLAQRVLTQKRRDPLPKVYSLHAPEVECIGKGKAHKPYEFGCKVSVATTNARAPGGQFVTHVKAFHGNPGACPRAGQGPDPGDGHTLKAVIEEMERWTRDPGRAHLRRQGLCWPRLPELVQGLQIGPEAGPHPDHQTRAPAPIGRRTGDRPHEERRTIGP